MVAVATDSIQSTLDRHVARVGARFPLRLLFAPAPFARVPDGVSWHTVPSAARRCPTACTSACRVPCAAVHRAGRNFAAQHVPRTTPPLKFRTCSKSKAVSQCRGFAGTPLTRLASLASHAVRSRPRSFPMEASDLYVTGAGTPTPPGTASTASAHDGLDAVLFRGAAPGASGDVLSLDTLPRPSTEPVAAWAPSGDGVGVRQHRTDGARSPPPGLPTDEPAGRAQGCEGCALSAEELRCFNAVGDVLGAFAAAMEGERRRRGEFVVCAPATHGTPLTTLPRGTLRGRHSWTRRCGREPTRYGAPRSTAATAKPSWSASSTRCGVRWTSSDGRRARAPAGESAARHGEEAGEGGETARGVSEGNATEAEEAPAGGEADDAGREG